MVLLAFQSPLFTLETFPPECVNGREGHVFLVILEEKFQVVLCVSLAGQFNISCSDRDALLDS